jgi:dihydrofolate reductase
VFLSEEDAMRKVIYLTTMSLDGYIDASSGDAGWAVPDATLHVHFNDLEREFDTHLYGKRMYELMAAYWPIADEKPSAPAYEVAYAKIWRSVPKVVFSTTLAQVGWNSRLVRENACAEVTSLKQQPGKSMSVGGSMLASELAARGLIDEYRLYFVPVFLGAGTPVLAHLTQRIRLEPIETRIFGSGTVLVRCRSAALA